MQVSQKSEIFPRSFRDEREREKKVLAFRLKITQSIRPQRRITLVYYVGLQNLNGKSTFCSISFHSNIHI